jgi:tRNA A-37 threonylcarbamoyl transferase component Bud32
VVATPDELAPGTLAGDYRIEEKIGEGGMGMVYRAIHPMIGKRAAIKVIHRNLSSSGEAVDRFIREAQSVNRIGDPNIVDVFGFGELADGRSFIVMEWLQGESLRDRLARPLPTPEIVEILETIASALHAAHAAGVVHRDLKPDNVFLATGRGVKLLDFGLAKLHNKPDAMASRTRTGAVMGTPLYLSPEQAKGQTVTPATDIYSLGAMAYEMCSSVAPFNAESAVEIMAMHISATPVPLGEIAPWTPPELAALVHAMLAKDPAQRPTLDHVRERLAVCRDLPARASVPDARPVGALASAPTLVSPVGTRARWPFALVAIALLGGGAAYWMWAREMDTQVTSAKPAEPAAPVETPVQVHVEARTQEPEPPPATEPAPAPAPAVAAPAKHRKKREAKQPTEPVARPKESKEQSIDINGVHDPFKD